MGKLDVQDLAHRPGSADDDSCPRTTSTASAARIPTALTTADAAPATSRSAATTAGNGRVVAVEPRLVFGSEEELEEALCESCASSVANTSFVERQNATDRHRNARKGRKTYRFSKDWQVHEAMTYLTLNEATIRRLL
jgi:hypothetical protein